jgi:nitrate reductase alpha subunit
MVESGDLEFIATMDFQMTTTCQYSHVVLPGVTWYEKTELAGQFVKSGRIEFYKDENIMLQCGEALPVHKPPFEESEYALNPETKEKYKFVFLTRNAIYRVHSTHFQQYLDE